MQRRDFHLIDKTSWISGIWQQEPDRIEWFDDASGLHCLVLRSPQMGHLCGYVGIAPNHPAWGVHYDGISMEDADERHRRYQQIWAICSDLRRKGLNIEEAHGVGYRKVFDDGWKEQPTNIGALIDDLQVHGGLTFAGHIDEEKGPRDMSPELGNIDPKGLWWFGFDAAHAFDMTMMSYPGNAMMSIRQTIYRDVDYMIGECTELAGQLAAMLEPPIEARRKKRR